MKDKNITKDQLLIELAELRQQITELEKSEIKHKQIEKALRDNEEKFRILVEMDTNGILLETVEGQVVECNTAGAKIYGYTKEEMIGLTIADLVPEDFAKKLPKVITDKETTHGIFQPRISKKKDGTIFPTEIATKIVNIRKKSRLIVYIRDITKRKKEEKKLKETRKMFTSLFNSSPEAALYHDEDGCIVNINPHFTELFGYTLKEIKGRNIDEGIIYPKNKIEEGKRLTKKALALKGFTDYETIRKKKDGTLVSVIISASPVIIGGRPQGTIALYRDITERKQNEQLNTVLYNISKAANSRISLDQLYSLIHKELGTIIDTTNFYIALVDEKEDKIYFPYHVDEQDDDFPIEKFSTTNTLTTYVIKTGKPLLNDNNQYKEMTAQGILTPMGTTTTQSIWLGVPLKIEDEIIGAMVVQSYIDPYLYTEKDIKLMEFVSEQIATAIQRKQLEEEMEKLAHFDTLTGSCNRGYGLALLGQQLKLARRKKYKILLAYTDIDDFKNINDIFGHGEGDLVLKEVAKLLKSTLREIDIVCRMGGDEFLLIFPDSSLNDLSIIRERISKSLTQLNHTLKKSYKIGLSLGVSEYDPDNPQSMDELIRISDNRMYEEKKKKVKRK
ncbi:MAG: PAS domain S-box protein [Candidatus Atribacteria bacterium]